MRFAVLILAFGLLCTPAHAQREVAAVVSADAVMRGLRAQHEAAIILDRRLADEREARLIEQQATALRNARQRSDAGLAGARAELEQARAAYAQLVSNVALRDSASRVEIEAYRAEAQNLVQTASPELLDAYQRFADGDRRTAWPVIEALTQASVRATTAAANARSAAIVRNAAQARETMRLNGEATIADVVALWNEAARLDPGDYNTQVQRAELLWRGSDIPHAVEAGQAALAAARTPRERVAAHMVLRRALLRWGDFEGVRTHIREALPLARDDWRDNPTDINAAHALHQVLFFASIAPRASSTDSEPLFQVSRRDYIEEALQVTRQALILAPDDAGVLNDLSYDLAGVGRELQGEDNERAETYLNESLTMAERNVSLHPSRPDVLDVLGEAHSQLGYFHQRINDTLARQHFSAWLSINRQLVRIDPGNGSFQDYLCNSLQRMAELSDADEAFGYLLECMAISQQLAEADPTNNIYTSMARSALDDVNRRDVSPSGWREIIAQFERRAAHEALTDVEQRQLTYARQRLAAQGTPQTSP